MKLLKKLKELFTTQKKNTKRGYVIKTRKDGKTETLVYNRVPFKNGRAVLTEYRINDKVVYPFNLEEKSLDLIFSSAPERNKRILSIALAQKNGGIVPAHVALELRKEEELKRLKVYRERLVKVHALRERE